MLDEGVDQPLAKLPPVRQGRGGGSTRSFADVEQGGEQRQQPLDLDRGTLEEGAQLADTLRLASDVVEPGARADHGDDGVEGRVAVDRRALQEQARGQLAADDSLVQRAGESRLPDPALAGQHHDLTTAAACLFPQIEQERQLAVSIDEIGTRGARRLEAVDRGDAGDLPDPHRVIDPLEGLLAAIDQGEQVAEQLAGERADDHAVHGCDALDAGGEVGRLAERLGQATTGAVRCGAAIGDDGPRTDADAHRQIRLRPARRAREPDDGGDDVECGQDGTFRGLLQRARVAEVGLGAVTDVANLAAAVSARSSVCRSRGRPSAVRGSPPGPSGAKAGSSRPDRRTGSSADAVRRRPLPDDPRIRFRSRHESRSRCRLRSPPGPHPDRTVLPERFRRTREAFVRCRIRPTGAPRRTAPPRIRVEFRRAWPVRRRTGRRTGTQPD